MRIKDIYRHGPDLNSHDLLKIAAISAMVIDHVGKYFLANNVWMRVLGRLAAPQFFFLVGYSGSYRFKRWILIYGLALVAVSYVTDSGTGFYERIAPLNILLSFVLIKALLGRFDPARQPTENLFALLAVLIIFSLPGYLLIEYGTLGLCYAIGGRLRQQRHEFAHIWLFATVGVHFFFELFFLPILEPEMAQGAVVLGMGLLVVVFLANLTIFVSYGFRLFRVENKPLKTVGIYVSRYSLEIYFFHLSAFMIASYV
jgi:hypothetical protein